ncbi:hypothetical protein U1Q18_015900 [Sarracenia purpurea var. burkii]
MPICGTEFINQLEPDEQGQSSKGKDGRGPIQALVEVIGDIRGEEVLYVDATAHIVTKKDEKDIWEAKKNISIPETLEAVNGLNVKQL